MNRIKGKPALFLALLMVSLLALPACGLPGVLLEAVRNEAPDAAAEATAPVTADRGAEAPAAEISSSGELLDALEDTLGDIYDRVSLSVVHIEVGAGLGSGFVWDTDGHIVTNHHVVDGARTIQVTFGDDTTVPAEVVGTDPDSDLAVIKVDVPAEQLHPVRLADSTRVRVGQLAVAIGNPFGLDGTMTVGFVSALGRSLPVSTRSLIGATYSIPDIIQTDAPINPGNSGGVLVDDEGEVIGVPTAIESLTGSNAGVGFAVPSTIVERVVPALIKEGAYAHPWIGISGTTLDSQIAEAMGLDTAQRGVLVAEVLEGSPAEEAGLQGSARTVEIDGLQASIGGDVIVAIDDQPVREFEDLIVYLARSTSVGQTVRLTVLREGEEEMIDLRLAARPAAESGQVETERPQMPRGTAGSAWLGIQGLELTPEIAEALELPEGQEGVLIASVVDGSPAEEAGLRGSDDVLDLEGGQLPAGGDVIIALDGEPVEGMASLRTLLAEAGAGEEVRLTVLRDGEEVDVDVTLGERPTTLP
ncbi:MAG: trypsin-like peptidase domain-containing protein [Anaerolineae bacterium]|nr:trypsin-like peptidase domain-containing protein [Anaerolineae bacterium]